MVKLGVQDNFTQSLDNSLKKASKNVAGFAGKWGKSAFLAGSAVVSATVMANVAVAKFIGKLVDADDELEAFAKQNGLTRDEAFKTKSALDAMGKSMEEIEANPRLLQQYQELRENAENLKPPDMSEGLDKVRAISGEYTKLKQTGSAAFQWIGHYALKHMAKPLEQIQEKMGGLNETLVKNLPAWSEKIGVALSWIVRLGMTVIRGAGAVFNAIKKIFDMIPGQVKIATTALAALALFIRAGPIGKLITILSVALLLLEDFFTYLDGGESLLAPVWKTLTGIFDGFTKGGENALDFFSTEFLPSLLALITSLFPQLVDMAMSFVDPLLNFGVQIITGLIQVLAASAPQLAAAAGDMALVLLGALLAVLPSVLNAGAEIALSLVSGLSSMIPELIGVGIQLLEKLLSTLYDGGVLEQILEAGVNLVLALAEGLISALPDIAKSAANLLSFLLSSIVNYLPQLIQMGINLVLSLVSGLGRALPDIVKSAIELVLLLIATLLSNLPEIAKAGGRILLMLIQGILELREKLNETALNIGLAILEALSKIPEKMKEAGKKLIRALVDGILSMGSWVKDKVGGFLGGIVDTIKGGGGGGDSPDPNPAPGPTSGGGMAGHADGGVFDQEHVARFAEENKPEAVVPLTKPNRAKEVLGEVEQYLGGGSSNSKNSDALAAGVDAILQKADAVFSRFASAVDKVVGHSGDSSFSEMAATMQTFLEKATGMMAQMDHTITAGATVAAAAGPAGNIIYNNQKYDMSSSTTVHTSSDQPQKVAGAVERTQQMNIRNMKDVIV